MGRARVDQPMPLHPPKVNVGRQVGRRVVVLGANHVGHVVFGAAGGVVGDHQLHCRELRDSSRLGRRVTPRRRLEAGIVRHSDVLGHPLGEGDLVRPEKLSINASDISTEKRLATREKQRSARGLNLLPFVDTALYAQYAACTSGTTSYLAPNERVTL